MSSMVPTDDTDARVDSILSQMTIEEKIDLLGGVDGFFIRDVPRLKLPRFKMADGPIGCVILVLRLQWLPVSG
jgi:beta-glucosidase